MHSLLERQIRKFLSEELKKDPRISEFFNAVDKSYSDFDEKLKMVQRATVLGSKELSEANKKLNAETQSQRKVLDALSKALAIIEHREQGQSKGTHPFDPHKLVEDIERQAAKLVEITAEKEALLRSLEQRNESLNNYAHMVSHDLKSPVRNVHSLVSWVFEDGSNAFQDQTRKNVDLVFQNLAKMDSLIDGILKHATIDSLEEKLTIVDLNHLITEIKQTVYVPATTKIRLRNELPKLYTSKYRMEQLFKNLITNALTATENCADSHIQIDVTDQNTKWLFSITDNGKGIPEHLQEGIFDMFKKLENTAGTTGIGLALVKKIINFYKGDIWLSSKVGHGTTFFFTILKQK